MRISRGQSYRKSHFEFKDPHADEEAQYNADARRKVLDDVVGIANDQASQQASSRLQHDRRPHNRIVALEKAVLANPSAVLPHDAANESSNHGIEAQLQIAHPHASLRGALLEQLLEIDARKPGNRRCDENCSHAEGVVHGGLDGVKIVVDALIGGRAAGEMRCCVFDDGVAQLMA